MNNKTKNYHHGDLAAQILQRAAEVIDEHGIDALSLRGIARDLGVSHGAPNRHFKNSAALLAALATDGWLRVQAATLSAAEETESEDPRVRLNAMGRGFLSWALNHRALFRTLMHPDVARFADDHLVDAMSDFSNTVRDAVQACQKVGRHADVPLPILSLYTNAVPFGAAMLLINPLLSTEHPDMQALDDDDLIEQIIQLVVPI